MKYSIAVAYPEAFETAPFLFRGDLKTIIGQAHDSGYDAVELHIRRPDAVNPGELKAFAESLGMEFSGVATGMSCTMDGLSMVDEAPEGRRAAVSRLCRYVDLAEALGCCVIVGSIRGSLLPGEAGRHSLAQFEEGLGEVLDYAKGRGVTVCIEAINRYENNYLNTVEEVKRLTGKLGRDNLKIHIDTFHMNIEERSFETAAACGGKEIGYVHLADNNRHYPGDGMLDFDRFAACLRAVDYDGYVSLECLPLPDAKTAADAGIQVMRRLWG